MRFYRITLQLPNHGALSIILGGKIMFRPKLFFSLIVALSFTLLPCLVSAQVYFEDDFSQGMSNWVDLWGNWDIQDGALHQSLIDGNCMAVIADGAWQDSWTEYTIELRGKRLSGGEGFLIMFRLNGEPEVRGKNFNPLPPGMEGQSPKTEYWWNIGGWGNTRTVIERWIDSARIEAGLVEPHGVVTDQWHDIKIENRLDGYTLYFDGEELADIEDAEVQNGRIGLATWATEALFDDIVVYGPNGPTAVEPSGKLPANWGAIRAAY